MNEMRVVTHGTLRADGTLELSERLPLPPGPVRVTVEAVPQPAPARPGVLEVLAQIRKDQAARGYTGRTVEEMRAEEAARRAEDEEEEERWRQVWERTGGTLRDVRG